MAYQRWILVLLLLFVTRLCYFHWENTHSSRKLEENEAPTKRDRAKKGRIKRARAFQNVERVLNRSGSFDRANFMPIPVNSDQIFLFQALRFVESAQQLVFFNGPRAKQIFDTQNLKPHILLNRRFGAVNWDQFVLKLSQYFNLTDSTSSNLKAVHIHNEEKIGDLLLLIVEIYKKQNKLRYPKPETSLKIDRKSIQDIVNTSPVRLAFTNTIDENWGFLSSMVGTRTTKWINMTNHLRIHYSDYTMLRDFLDSDKVLLLTTNTHVDPQIGFHEKVICLPLGIRAREEIFRQAKHLLTLNVTKTKILTINNSGWGDRKMINEMVSKAFNETVKNSYQLKRKREYSKDLSSELIKNLKENYIDNHIYEIATSKFVLCPSGLGMDTYRLWETLLLGSIPIVESNKGFDRTYSMLPVFVIPDFSLLTPQLLDEVYPCFQKYILKFHYHYLLEGYWLELIDSMIQDNSIDLLTTNHPPKNPYCSFF